MSPAYADLEAFAVAEGPGLHRLAFLITGGRAAEADDIVQSVLERLLRRGLVGLADPRAYARRAVVNEHRSLHRRRVTAATWLSRTRVPEGTSDPAVDDRFAVLAALRTLGDRERAAIVLRYYEDRPDEEIAQLLGCTRSTVRSIVHRALPRLRQQLSPDDLSTHAEQEDPR